MDVAIWVAIIGGFFSIGVVLVTKWHETRSTNIAVLAEVQRLLSILESHKKWWQERITANDTRFPLLTFTTPIFDLQTQNVGQINKDIVAMVVRFYSYLKFINALQAERPKYIADGKSTEFDQQYLRVLENLWGDYKNAFDPAFREYGLLPKVGPACI